MMHFPRQALWICEIGAIHLRGQHEYFEATATGHLVKDNDNTCLVTAGHVLEGLDFIGVRVNRRDDALSRIAKLSIDRFKVNASLDIAVASIVEDPSFPMAVVHTDDLLSPAQMKEIRLTEGRQISVSGYPNLPTLSDSRERMVGFDHSPIYATVKHGYIARIADWYSNHSSTIVIDCDIFPGNSGSLVLTRQQLYDEKPYYLGMVTDFIPYVDEGAGKEVKLPRFPFKQNSGYAHIAPADAIKEMLTTLQPGAGVRLDFLGC